MNLATKAEIYGKLFRLTSWPVVGSLYRHLCRQAGSIRTRRLEDKSVYLYAWLPRCLLPYW